MLALKENTADSISPVCEDMVLLSHKDSLEGWCLWALYPTDRWKKMEWVRQCMRRTRGKSWEQKCHWRQKRREPTKWGCGYILGLYFACDIWQTKAFHIPMYLPKKFVIHDHNQNFLVGDSLLKESNDYGVEVTCCDSPIIYHDHLSKKIFSTCLLEITSASDSKKLF